MNPCSNAPPAQAFVLDALHGDEAILRPDGRNSSCPQCAAGQGCGASLWYQRFLKKDQQLHLPRSILIINSIAPNIGDRFLLSIPADTLSLAALILYGMPLLAFFVGLFLTSFLPLWVQGLCAFALLAATIATTRGYFTRFVLKRVAVKRL